MKMSCRIERWPTLTPFRIAGIVLEEFVSIVVQVQDGDAVGHGQAHGVYYMDETPESLFAQVDALRPRVEAGLDRAELQTLLPPGGARNALDCALWDLEAKASRTSIWELTGVPRGSLETVYSIGIEATPAQMAQKAAAATSYGILKIKLDGHEPVARIRAIRDARPDAVIVIDVNQGWTFGQLQEVAPQMATLGVKMIEQPLPRGQDAALAGYRSPVKLCADESCLHLGELDQVDGKYDMINVKLDKTGGLTHALELVRAARARDLEIMVGCMGGSSLAVAPAFVIGRLSHFVDIDGPLLQRHDRLPGLRYDGGTVSAFGSEVWG